MRSGVSSDAASEIVALRIEGVCVDNRQVTEEVCPTEMSLRFAAGDHAASDAATGDNRPTEISLRLAPETEGPLKEMITQQARPCAELAVDGLQGVSSRATGQSFSRLSDVDPRDVGVSSRDRADSDGASEIVMLPAEGVRVDDQDVTEAVCPMGNIMVVWHGRGLARAAKRCLTGPLNAAWDLLREVRASTPASVVVVRGVQDA
ncbi:hypothetical protein BKA62DRAFT_785526 [Auriculariales sp. MPI-PUGE-AT-0066]|nr:hypothetical protein BKA62DRAFT_785526 [Auriculariales sp. MPI-PUGE-AT-0066]